MAMRARAKASLLQASQGSRSAEAEPEPQSRAAPPVMPGFAQDKPNVTQHVVAAQLQREDSDDGCECKIGKIIAQGGRVPDSSFKSLRTAWTTQSDCGLGFFRDTNRYAPVAISCQDLGLCQLATRQQQSFQLVETAADFAAMVTTGGDLAVEGWGATVSASFDMSSRIRFSPSALTAVLRRTAVSDPVLVVRPAADRLTATAFELLASGGPAEFHETYGSHFVAGYTVGGVFLGTYQVLFASAAAAAAYRTYFQACMSRFGSSGGESAEFASEIESSSDYQRTEVAYRVSGWKASSGPAAVRDLDSLFQAAAEMQVDGGERVDAVLMPYDALEAYQAGLKQFATSHAGTHVAAGIGADEFAMVAQLLTQEALFLAWLERMVVALTPAEVARAPLVDERITGLVWKTLQRRQRIRRRFGTAADASESWRALSAYVQALLGGEEEAGRGEDAEAVAAGEKLAEAVFTYNHLHEEYARLAERVCVVWEVGVSMCVLKWGEASGPPSEAAVAVDIDWEDGGVHRGYRGAPGAQKTLRQAPGGPGGTHTEEDGFVTPPQVFAMLERFTDKPDVRPAGVKLAVRDREGKPSTVLAEHRFNTMMDESVSPPAVYNRFDRVVMVKKRVGTGSSKFRVELSLTPLAVFKSAAG